MSERGVDFGRLRGRPRMIGIILGSVFAFGLGGFPGLLLFSIVAIIAAVFLLVRVSV